MKKAHFYAYGIIGEQDPFFTIFTGEEDPNISAKKVADFLNANADAEAIVVHINSRGGSVSEGFAIHDLLANSGKKIMTVAEGLVASIATVVFLAGTDREVMSNAQLMIHNPWIDPTLIAGLTADEIQKMANDMKQEENRMVDFYSLKTGVEKGQIADMMKTETTFNADKALELKFATKILEPTKALAYYKNSQSNSNPILSEMKDLKKLVNDLKNQITGKGAQASTASTEAKAESHDTNDGKTINIDGPVEVGSAVTDADGNPTPDASYTLADGTMIKTDADSKISEVTPPAAAAAAATEDTADVKALKAENKSLKDRINALETEHEEIANTLLDIKKNLKSTHVVPSGQTNLGRQQASGKGNRIKSLKEQRKEAKDKEEKK